MPGTAPRNNSETCCSCADPARNPSGVSAGLRPCAAAHTGRCHGIITNAALSARTAKRGRLSMGCYRAQAHRPYTSWRSSKGFSCKGATGNNTNGGRGTSHAAAVTKSLGAGLRCQISMPTQKKSPGLTRHFTSVLWRDLSRAPPRFSRDRCFRFRVSFRSQPCSSRYDDARSSPAPVGSVLTICAPALSATFGRPCP